MFLKNQTSIPMRIVNTKVPPPPHISYTLCRVFSKGFVKFLGLILNFSDLEACKNWDLEKIELSQNLRQLDFLKKKPTHLLHHSMGLLAQKTFD